jgi:hypothetical protein
VGKGPPGEVRPPGAFSCPTDPGRCAGRTDDVDRRSFLAGAAAVPIGLALDPAAFAGRLGGRPTALVTADLEGHVAAVELTTGRVLRRIATVDGPRSIEAGGGRAIVAHTTEGVVTLLDADSLRVVRVLRSFAAPRYTAVHPRGDHAYVTDSARGELVTIELDRGRVVHRLDLGGPARHVSVDRMGRTLWTALGTKARALAIVDVSRPARPRSVARLRPPFLAHDVGFAPRGGRVWVTSGDRGALALYGAGTREVVARLPADAPPQHVTFVGRRACVTSGDDGTLRVQRLDGRRLRLTRVPGGSYNVQQGLGSVLTPSLSQGTLCVLDAQGRLLRRMAVARSSHDACVVLTA